MKKIWLLLLCISSGYLSANALNNPVTNPCIQRPELPGCGANGSGGGQSVIMIPNRWGAIYFNPENLAIGYSSNNRTSYRAAEREALEGCIRAGGGNPIASDGKGCRLMTKYRNSCGAIAVGRRGAASARNDSNLERVEQKALAACNKRDEGCKVYHSNCSRDPRYIVTD